MAANYWRASNTAGGVPTLVYSPACVYAHLAQAIDTRQEHRRADHSSPPKRHADILRVNLTSDPSQSIRVQGIAFAAFAGNENEIARKQHHALRSQVGVARVFVGPVCWRKRILQLQGGRELQHRVAVIPIPLGDFAVTN